MKNQWHPHPEPHPPPPVVFKAFFDLSPVSLELEAVLESEPESEGELFVSLELSFALLPEDFAVPAVPLGL